MTHIGLSRKQITWTTKEVYNEHIENIFVKPKLKTLSGRENLKNTSNNEISKAFKIKVKWQKNKKTQNLTTKYCIIA